MRLIDADALIEWIDENVSCDTPYALVTKAIVISALKSKNVAPTVDGWEGADKRPPKKGRYLVWKVCRFTPDHYGDPDGYWKMDILHWDEKYGWSFEKVKYWMPLPEPPKEGE